MSRTAHGTSAARGTSKLPEALRVDASGLIVLGCVYSNEILVKAHSMLLSQACQPELDMM